jgi:hypothetical protein
MAATRADLDKLLDVLEAMLPDLMKDNPDDGDFWAAFAGQADVIEDSASADDAAHVRGRINCMLGSKGLIPSDNEGEPCTSVG